jgi:NAD(P)-dependent dehydrogenase (short-subunit alcohol dehydrogenase family)
VCRAFDREGAAVVVVDIDGAGAERTASELRRAVAVTADVTNESQADAAVARAVAEFGGLDVLTNIAGYFGDAPLAKPASEVTATMTTEEWRRFLAINLDGTFFFVRAALRVMLPRRSGVIVNTSSINGVEGFAGYPHYSAAKAGVLGLTRAVAKEVLRSGIRVNAVAPGPVDTPLARRTGTADPSIFPMGRRATADEIASVVLFLASDESAYMTGETVNVNGGLLTI